MGSIEMQLAAVIGTPISHSKSPLIHGYWLKKYGINGSYIPLEVRESELKQAVLFIKTSGFQGFNVTIPHKEAMLDLVDEITEEAQSIGAINTVYRDGDKWVGDNTDYKGFLNSLPHGFTPKSSLVIGAGGAARAICFALGQIKSSITLCNRTFERAQKLALEFSPLFPCHTASFEVLGDDLSAFDLIVNTTSCGLKNENNLIINTDTLSSKTIVYDLVYTPLKTELLAQAQRNNCVSISGIEMLCHQAVGGFEKWFGVQPEIDEPLKKLLLE